MMALCKDIHNSKIKQTTENETDHIRALKLRAQYIINELPLLGNVLQSASTLKLSFILIQSIKQ